MRQAQLDHPLNWILILFAGVIFLLFFITTSYSLLETNSQVSSLELQEELVNGFTQSVAQGNTKFSLTLPPLTTSCSTEQGYAILFKNQENTFPYRTIISPTYLSERTTVLSREVTIGYPLMPITYLLSQNTLLLLVDTSTEIQELFSPFENSVLTTTSQELSTFPLRGYDTVIVLTQNTLQGVQLAQQNQQEIYGVQIFPSNTRQETGTLQYYTYTTAFQQTSSVTYTSTELLLAGTLSGTAKRYACSLQPLEEKFRFITALNKERMQQISSVRSWPQTCMQAYQNLDTLFTQVLQDASFTITDISKTTQYAASIAQASQVLLNARCPNTR